MHDLQAQDTVSQLSATLTLNWVEKNTDFVCLGYIVNGCLTHVRSTEDIYSTHRVDPFGPPLRSFVNIFHPFRRAWYLHAAKGNSAERMRHQLGWGARAASPHRQGRRV
jgi:hypothetical protein